MNKIRIAIADDHPVVTAGICGLLSNNESFDVVGTATDGREALAIALRLEPDVILMDLAMPNMTGFEAIAAIKVANIKTEILVLTTYDTAEDVRLALEAGALGYLLKDASPPELFRAIEDVAQGRRAMTKSVEARVAEGHKAPFGTLSEREVDVLRLVAGGGGNRAIAKALFISEATVKTHLIHIHRKLGVKDRTSAVTEAGRLGILRLRR